MSYSNFVLSLNPTHYVPLNNSLSDLGSGPDLRESTNPSLLPELSGATFEAKPITKESTHSLRSNNGHADLRDSTALNIGTNTITSVTYCVWAELTDLSVPTAVFKIGGNARNMAIVAGFGAGSQAMVNGSTTLILNTYGSRAIEVNRPYLLAMTWRRASQNDGSNTICQYFINGVLEGSRTLANTGAMEVHNGNISIGNSTSVDSLIFYGGQLPVNVNRNNKWCSHWMAFANTVLTNEQIYQLFEQGVLPAYTVTSQSDVNNLPDLISRQNLGVLVDVPGSIELDFSGVTFQESDIDIQYGGTGLLTVRTSQSLITSTINGGSIVFEAPQNAITLTGLPEVDNVLVAVQDLSSNGLPVTYPAVTGASIQVQLDPESSYRIIADAPGYLAQAVVLAGATPAFEFSLPDFRALYLAGVNRSAQLAFNYESFRVTVSDALAAYPFADVFRTLEDYLATAVGILFPFPPRPVQISSGAGVRNYLVFPFDTQLGVPNPVRIAPAPGNVTDPVFPDFVTILEGAEAPLFDIFDFAQAGGRTIRFQTEAVSAASGATGGGEIPEGLAETLDLILAHLEADRLKLPARDTRFKKGTYGTPEEEVIYDKAVSPADGGFLILDYGPSGG